MKIIAENLRLGEDPTEELTKNGNTLVTVKLAENINSNKGTREKPEWETVRTNWYRMSAFGDVAQELLSLKKGDKISVEGTHERNYKDGKEYSNYTIKEFSRG